MGWNTPSRMLEEARVFAVDFPGIPLDSGAMDDAWLLTQPSATS
jgi:hypothetical protein